eukprot:14161-Heterococcus_DN1.PRE.2
MNSKHATCNRITVCCFAGSVLLAAAQCSWAVGHNSNSKFARFWVQWGCCVMGTRSQLKSTSVLLGVIETQLVGLSFLSPTPHTALTQVGKEVQIVLETTSLKWLEAAASTTDASGEDTARRKPACNVLVALATDMTFQRPMRDFVGWLNDGLACQLSALIHADRISLTGKLTGPPNTAATLTTLADHTLACVAKKGATAETRWLRPPPTAVDTAGVNGPAAKKQRT